MLENKKCVHLLWGFRNNKGFVSLGFRLTPLIRDSRFPTSPHLLRLRRLGGQVSSLRPLLRPLRPLLRLGLLRLGLPRPLQEQVRSLVSRSGRWWVKVNSTSPATSTSSSSSSSCRNTVRGVPPRVSSQLSPSPCSIRLACFHRTKHGPRVRLAATHIVQSLH